MRYAIFLGLGLMIPQVAASDEIIDQFVKDCVIEIAVEIKYKSDICIAFRNGARWVKAMNQTPRISSTSVSIFSELNGGIETFSTVIPDNLETDNLSDFVAAIRANPDLANALDTIGGPNPIIFAEPRFTVPDFAGGNLQAFPLEAIR